MTRGRPIRRFALIAALACGVIVAGQEGPPIPGRWAEMLPLNRFHRGWNRRDFIKVTPAQATEMQRLADRIVSIVRSSTAMPPPGFEVEFTASTDWADYLQTRPGMPSWALPLRAQFLFYKLRRDCATCPVESTDQPSAFLSFFINDVGQVGDFAEGRGLQSANGYWRIVPRVMGEEHGMPVYESPYGSIVLTRTDRPLWFPVSQAEYMDRIIRWRASEVDKAQTEIARTGARDTRTVADMQARIAELKKSDPDEAARWQEAIDETRPILATSQDLRGDDLREKRRLLAETERDLAAMTPAERAKPAVQAAPGLARYRNSVILGAAASPAAERASLLANDGQAGRPVMAWNQAFLDTTLARTAPQLLVMTGGQYGGTPQEAGERDADVLAMRRAVYDSLDWSAVRALVGK
jgi:hypothetical protein